MSMVPYYAGSLSANLVRRYGVAAARKAAPYAWTGVKSVYRYATTKRKGQGGAGRRKPQLKLGRSLTLPSGYLPRKYRLTLRYADSLTVSSGTVSSVFCSWKANGIFAPEVAVTSGISNNKGTSAQPQLRDTMATLYAQYQVKSSTIRASFINHDPSNADAQFLCVHLGTDNDTKDITTPKVPDTTDEILQSGIPGYQYRVIGGSDNSLSKNTITKKWSLRKLAKGERDDSNVVVTADPTSGNLNNFIVSVINGKDANSVEGRLYVTILYDVEFSQPNDILAL